MVVEELGDYYNVAIENDERVEPLVRELNRVHHIDEARHLAFGRAYLAELFERTRAKWSAETLAAFRAWLVEYLKCVVGRLLQPHDVPRCRPRRRLRGAPDGAVAPGLRRAPRSASSAKLVNYFIKTGLLAEEPQL